MIKIVNADGHEPNTNSAEHAIRVQNRAPNPELCEKMSRETGFPYLFSSLLCLRGISTGSEAQAFLQPRLADLPSPFLLKDMREGTDLVVRAIREQWPICIHGDYDVDGISATALLANFFQKLDVTTICYQPDRLTEGYGLQPGFIQNNAPETNQHSLLITVDCGISAHAEIRLAREKGFSVIITDHHEPPETIPEADAVINPKQKDCSFPFSELSGVGVAFFLAVGIRNALIGQGMLDADEAPNLKQFTDLVALGTVADVMPVTGINRILIRAGLEVMSGMPSPWVIALKTKAKIENNQVTSSDISFRFAPRLNAPGRLGKPELSFELLTCDDPVRALDIAAAIDEINSKRRRIEGKAVDGVLAECDKQVGQGVAGLVVSGRYHPGVIGILASRVVDKYNRPVIVFSEETNEPGILKGSGRSIESINLFESLQLCSDTIIQFGGHPMAAGLTVTKENLPIFSERFNFAISRQIKPGPVQAEVIVDSVVQADELFDDAFLNLYEQLEPFGSENPEPVFLLKGAEIIKPDCLKNHLTFMVKVNGTMYRGIGFKQADKVEQLRSGKAQLAVTIRKNMFRGVERLEVYAHNVI